MPEKKISSREFHQDTASATRAAQEGPVIVTKRGQPIFVLLRFDEYSNLVPRAPKKRAKKKSIVELLAMPEGTPEFEYEFPRLEFRPRPVDFD